jgi:hypothetical protein
MVDTINFIIIGIRSGVVGTEGITGSLWRLDRCGKVIPNMDRAVASAFTRDYKTSLFPGSPIQFGSGMIFAIVYNIFGMMPITYLASYSTPKFCFHLQPIKRLPILRAYIKDHKW